MLKQAVKVIAVSCLLVFTSGYQVKAQEAISQGGGTAIAPQKQALIRELLTVTNSNKTSNEMWNLMLSQMESSLPDIVTKMLGETTNLQGRELQQQARESSQRVFKRYRELLQQRVNLAEVTEQISYSVYSKFFTENELRDLIAFYKTPTGQKSITVMPQLMAESMSRSNEILTPKIIEIMQEVMREETQRVSPQKK